MSHSTTCIAVYTIVFGTLPVERFYCCVRNNIVYSIYNNRELNKGPLAVFSASLFFGFVPEGNAYPLLCCSYCLFCCIILAAFVSFKRFIFKQESTLSRNMCTYRLSCSCYVSSKCFYFSSCLKCCLRSRRSCCSYGSFCRVSNFIRCKKCSITAYKFWQEQHTVF